MSEAVPVPAPAMLQEFVVAENLYYRHLYYTDDDDGPCTGWQHALIYAIDGNSKVNIFCPFTGIELSVSRHHPLVRMCKLPRQATVPRILVYMTNKWETRLNELPFYIIKVLCPDLPISSPDVIEIDPGTQIEVKRIKRNGKRGRFLQFILDYDAAVPIKLLVSTFGIKRNNVLSYLYQMKKVNAVDYILNKSQDTVSVILPLHEVFE